MVLVKKMPGDSDDAVIRKFTRKVMESGVVLEAKRRQFHLNRNMLKKVKQEEARRLKRFATW